MLSELAADVVFPLLLQRLNIYTDPQKPMIVTQGIYPLNNPDENSPIAITTNFALTYFVVSAEVEASRVPTWLLIMDTEGMSVLTAWSAGTFREVLPPGADSARANWINGRGEVAGTRYEGGVPHAFLLRDGEYLDPTPGWGWSEATYVGEDGAVAGAGEFGAYISRGGVTEIFPGFSSVAMGNSSGQWVGRSGGEARTLKVIAFMAEFERKYG